MSNAGVAVVTGAGGMRSIGRAVAQRLARDGYDIVLSDFERPADRIGEDERAEGWQGMASTAREIEDLGRQARPVLCDLTDAASIDALIASAVDAFGPVDVLVN